MRLRSRTPEAWKEAQTPPVRTARRKHCRNLLGGRRQSDYALIDELRGSEIFTGKSPAVDRRREENGRRKPQPVRLECSLFAALRLGEARGGFYAASLVTKECAVSFPFDSTILISFQS
jgi:hypothetical protein